LYQDCFTGFSVEWFSRRLISRPRKFNRLKIEAFTSSLFGSGGADGCPADDLFSPFWPAPFRGIGHSHVGTVPVLGASSGGWTGQAVAIEDCLFSWQAMAWGGIHFSLLGRIHSAVGRVHLGHTNHRMVGWVVCQLLRGVEPNRLFLRRQECSEPLVPYTLRGPPFQDAHLTPQIYPKTL